MIHAKGSRSGWPAPQNAHHPCKFLLHGACQVAYRLSQEREHHGPPFSLTAAHACSKLQGCELMHNSRSAGEHNTSFHQPWRTAIQRHSSLHHTA
mmetsp:Transcript_27654/g.74844  ORF Transcript_27654/g.74844 Transcript_27654/m.74844 type:complete len:95 (-) Transcript_27654:1352-1636(-)|eukprot:1160545-Pelagomonas_calceolata.AAC.3